jgi:1,2-diacylglycerol 3-beta-galactosyltransferase
MGGGEGMGLLEPTALALAEALPPRAQIVVVCGRNAALASRLSARQWPCGMVVKGFVSDIDAWMGASDVVITKAGPGTIAEALIRGVPLLLNGAIPCQEEGNVPFVVEVRSKLATRTHPSCSPLTRRALQNGVGQFNTEPKAIAAQVAAWFGPKAEELAEMAAKAKALGRPNATFRIVRDLADLCTVKA